MSIAQVNVVVDQEFIKKEIQENLDKSFREVLFTWDVNEMAKRTCMSKATLEVRVLNDDRMRMLERRVPNGKRYWYYEKSLKVLEEIMDEW